MNLSFDQIKAVTQGAVRICEDGTEIRFHRFTNEQEALYQQTNESFYLKTFCPAGVKLEFRTDSPWLALEIEAFKAMPTRTYFSFDVYADGTLIGNLDNFSSKPLSDEYIFDSYQLGLFAKQFDLGKGEKTVQIYFPWSVDIAFRRLSLADGSSVIPVRPAKKLLTFGDSITQGYDALRPSGRYAGKLAEALGAEEFCKAIGGEVFFPPLAEAKDPFDPEYILVAYGTNDWSKTDRSVFQTNCAGFFGALCKNYPDAVIYALTPIWRKDLDTAPSYGPFDLVEQDLRNAVKDYPQVRMIRCFDFVPKDSAYFADFRLHPNDNGFAAYAEELINAI